MGTNIGEVGVGHSPQGVAVDPFSNLVYVANDGGSVSVLNGSSFIKNIAIGSTPYGVLFDPYNNLTYVTDQSLSEVFVLHGPTLSTSFGVPTGPLGLAVDPGTGLVYVADSGANEMTVIAGTSIQKSVPGGSTPADVAYSAANGDVYVTDSASNSVDVFNGTKLVANISVGLSPRGIAYDALNQYLYVADNLGNQTSIIYGTSVIATVSVGIAPDQVAWDPANGEVYVTNEGSGENNVSVLSGLKVVGQVTTGGGPRGLVADPNNGVVYVADIDDDGLTQISTELEESAPQIIDRGIPVDTTDVGQSITIVAPVLGPGSTGLTVTDHLQPRPGLGCAATPNLTSAPPGDVISLACSPTATGVYSVYLNVTDSDRSQVWGFIVIAVDGVLIVPPPTVQAYQQLGVPTVDVNQTVALNVQPSGGSGVYTSFNWTGLGGARCTGQSGSHPSCRFPTPGGYEIQVAVLDSNFGFNQSNPTPIAVDPDPVGVRPTANHTGADVTEAVTFSEAAYGGPGAYQYGWIGLEAAGCTGLDSAAPSCSFSSTGEVNVSVVVTDPTGARSTSPALPFWVYTLPTVTDPTSARAFADVGQTATFATSASGGFGGYNFSWSGLPTNCENLVGASIHCTFDAPETLQVLPSVVDGNGGRSSATGALQFQVNADPTVAPPTLSAASVVAGQGGLSISSDPVGGSGKFSFNWSGLPPGCSGRGASFSCSPSASGTYHIEVTVRDAAGFTITSGAANLTVGSPSALSTLVSSTGLVAIAAAIALVLLAVGWLRLRRRPARRRRARPEEPYAPRGDEPDPAPEVVIDAEIEPAPIEEEPSEAVEPMEAPEELD